MNISLFILLILCFIADAVSTDGIPNLNVELKSTEQEDGGVIEVVVYLDSRNTS